jgi:hypothetical protein
MSEKFESKYVLGEKIDKGGFGEVFACYLKTDKAKKVKYVTKIIYTA